MRSRSSRRNSGRHSTTGGVRDCAASAGDRRAAPGARGHLDPRRSVARRRRARAGSPDAARTEPERDDAANSSAHHTHCAGARRAARSPTRIIRSSHCSVAGASTSCGTWISSRPRSTAPAIWAGCSNGRGRRARQRPSRRSGRPGTAGVSSSGCRRSPPRRDRSTSSPKTSRSVRALEERLRQAQRMEAVGRLASEVAVTCDALLSDVARGARRMAGQGRQRRRPAAAR